jgi:polar amino acid transport system substrate-binding protein
MMKMTRIIMASAAVTVMMVTAACGGGDGDAGNAAGEDCKPTYTFDTIAKGKLTIAAPDAPPRFFGSPTSPEGFDPPILERFAKAACLEPVWVVIPQSSIIEAIRTRRADVAAGGWYRTEKRGEVVGQTEPYYADKATLVSKTGAGDIDDFTTMGTVTGFLWVDALKGIFGSKLQLFQSPDAVIQAISAGRIEGGLFSAIDGPWLAQKEGLKATPMVSDERVASSVTPGWANLPHTKGNTKLGEALSAEIKKMHEDGFIAKSMEKYGIDGAVADTSAFKGTP